MLAALDLSLGGRLNGITAALRPGELTAICGPNGAGKSSLLACLAGLHKPGGGEATLEGGPVANIAPRERARAIGYLPQSHDVAWDVSVETLVALGRLPWKTSPAEDRAAIEMALARMDLAALRDRPLSCLSGGEKARAHLARVLAGTPRWILADEPLANLDLAHAATLLGSLKDLAREGVGVVVVLHDLASAMNHADRVLVLHGGRLAADGMPQTALDEAVITRCWGVSMRWLGEPGRRALAPAP